MLRLAALLVPIAFLAGCDAVNETADNIARDRAKSVVNGVVTQKYPGVNAAPVTDCIIDAASAGEVLNIAGASVTGVTASTVEQVLEIAQRRDSVTCIAENGIALWGS
jgi:predicted ThiF/HesA family dinucleotide-utilizing enzyme